jgi:hypothetical protein
MKTQLIKQLLFFVITFQLGSCQTKKATVDSTKTEKKVEKKESKYAEGKMTNGTYFIINASENLALEPYQRQYNSLTDLNLAKLDNSAIQKWVVKENINAKTKKPNGTFSIYLFVDETNAIANKYNNPRLGKTKEYPKDSFVIEYDETGKSYIIKSNSAKGDCMGKKDGRFAKYIPNDGSQAILWKFLKTE